MTATPEYVKPGAFVNRTAIVTGGAGSFGRILCMELAKAGAKVVVNDLGGTYSGSGSSAEPAEKLAKEIRGLGFIAVADFHSVTDGQKIVDTAFREFGGLDILINNAAQLRYAPFEDQTIEDIDGALRVNALAPALLCHSVWAHFKKQKYGRIINFTSGSIVGMQDMAAYATSKGALIGLTKTLALEGGQHGITVNAVAPTAFSRMAGGDIQDLNLKEHMKNNFPPAGNVPLILALALEANEFNGEIFNTAAYAVDRWVLGLSRGIKSVVSAESCLEQKDRLVRKDENVSEMSSLPAILGWLAES